MYSDFQFMNMQKKQNSNTINYLTTSFEYNLTQSQSLSVKMLLLFKNNEHKRIFAKMEKNMKGKLQTHKSQINCNFIFAT